VELFFSGMDIYKPDVYIPSHHDAPFNGLWRATEPLFQALKDENPNIITVSRGYREPICFDTENNIQRRQVVDIIWSRRKV
jgi:hypothetical protein